jgi:hypothetical protein
MSNIDEAPNYDRLSREVKRLVELRKQLKSAKATTKGTNSYKNNMKVQSLVKEIEVMLNQSNVKPELIVDNT